VICQNASFARREAGRKHLRPAAEVKKENRRQILVTFFRRNSEWAINFLLLLQEKKIEDG
jgi:hypothetical protein